MDEQRPGGAVWRTHLDDELIVHMPIHDVRRGRMPMLIVTAHRQAGTITARIALDLRHDASAVSHE